MVSIVAAMTDDLKINEPDYCSCEGGKGQTRLPGHGGMSEQGTLVATCAEVSEANGDMMWSPRLSVVPLEGTTCMEAAL
jgi:hypothetical protein